MSWAARFTDTDRQRSLRLLVLKGEERRLDHARALLRQDLSVELQRRCRAGHKTAAAIALEHRISAVHAEWQTIIEEIRELRSTAA